MEAQLLQAVEIASSGTQLGQDPTVVQQALSFLEQAKENSQEVWSPAWSIFTARSTDGKRALYNHQQRLFGLSLVTDFLENKVTAIPDPAQAVAYLQASALQHFDDEFIAGSGEDNASFVKNKFAQFLSSLLIQTYGLPPPFTLLSDLVSRMRVHNASSSTSLNPLATDMVLRLLHEVSLALGSDVTLRAVRSRERIQRDTAIRDEIRQSQAVGIADSVWKVIEESYTKVQELSAQTTPAVTDSQGWSRARAEEITCEAAEVIGDYVSWIDISLIVTPHTVSLLYGLLQQGVSSIRSSAADALVEVVSKGMKSPDKLTLLQILNLTSSISELERKSRKPLGQNDDAMTDEEVTFREHLANLANCVAIELAKIVEDNSAASDVRAQADEMLLSHMDLVLDFLTDAYDELAEAVLPCIGTTLTIYKKLKKQSGAAAQTNGHASETTLSNEKSAFLSRLMGILLIKMKFADDSEWTGTHDADDDDEELDAEATGQFLELRKQLQHHATAIAGIDESLFSIATVALIIETFDACDAFLRNSAPAVSWQRVELALFATFFCGEVLATGGGSVKTGISPSSFVILPPNTAKSVRNKPPEGFLLSLTLNSLGEVIQRFFQSNVSSFRHPAVQMQYFECTVRYAAFFSVRPEMLADALSPFLDWRGIHNERKSVRTRVNYLFLRFVKEVREHIHANFVQSILENMQDLMLVRAVIPTVGPGEDPLDEAIKHSNVFDGQLDLFEACGVLLQLLRQTPERQSSLLQALIDPLSSQLRTAVQARTVDDSNLEAVLQVHHLFFALANLAKGFPDISPSSGAQSTSSWMLLFKPVIEEMLAALNSANLSSFKVIRDAARGAFSRMVNTTGFTVLPYVPALLQALLPRINETELLDFLSFLGLVTAKYKAEVLAVMDELLGPLLERTFFFLNQDVSGTDDALQRDQLIKGYVSFLSMLIGSGLDDVLRSDRNQSQLETVLQSFVYYATNAQPSTVRNIINVLSRLVNLWLSKTASASTNSTEPTSGLGSPKSALPGFEQFVYKTFVGLIFEIPSKASFDFADAQSQMVLTELCAMAKVIHQKRGQEFVDMLLNAYFPSINCPPDLAHEFVQGLEKQEVKAFKKSLEHFFARSRGTISTA